MVVHRVLGVGALATLLVAGPALAVPQHVVAARTTDGVEDGIYAVAPDLDAASRRALEAGLSAAGLRVAAADQAHDRLVTVKVGVHRICLPACVGSLDDNYRRIVVVTAQAERGAQARPDGPATWYAVLQSDGLSGRTDDYLPSLLRYGARAYGRSVVGERPPSLPRSSRYIEPELSAVG